METWLSDVNDFVSDEADELSYSVRVAALNLIMVSYCENHVCRTLYVCVRACVRARVCMYLLVCVCVCVLIGVCLCVMLLLCNTY